MQLDNTVTSSLNDELEKLRKQNEMLQLNIDELTRTNEFLVTATWREREMKQRLHEALGELTETKKLVDAQHKSITDSINYASRIQEAIIPKIDDLKDKFADIFIYHESKDIVSGDFPWVFENENYLYVAAVDCTGHGVPGAMMSLIGHLLLNDLARHGSLSPSQLLDHLHNGIVKTLKQDVPGKQTADGMDVALCRIDKIGGMVQYAGAHRTLYYVANNELLMYPGNKYPIGGNQYKCRAEFTNHILQPKKGESIYLFSDGLTDQFGGPDGIKLGQRRIREILLANSQLPMNEQKKQVKFEFDQWKGTRKQLDDLLLIGIKF